jgi:hypothetical protein
VPYARPAGGIVSKFKVGDGARSSSAPAAMRSDASSLSDADGASARRAGVAAPAPPPALPKVVPGPGEAAVSEG